MGRRGLGGLTLAEVLVASSIFIVVLGAVLFTLHAGKRNEKPADEQSQALRACLLASETLRSELKGAWVLGPGMTPGNSVEYRVPLTDASGQALLGPTGDISYSQTRELLIQNDRLVIITPQGDRIVTRMGPGSSLQAAQPDETTLDVTFHSGHGVGFTLQRSFRLVNQY